MIEKRFKADKYNFEIWDNDDFLLSFDQTVDLLNQLYDENEYLKLKLDTHKHPLWSTREAERIVNELQKENKQLKKLLECSREEANDYCEELMGKDELIRLYKKHIDEVIEENKQLQTKLDSLNDIDRNCYNCKHCSTYDEGPGYGFVSLCEKDCMNTDGYFDYEYHKFKGSVVCPLWEYDDDQ